MKLERYAASLPPASSWGTWMKLWEVSATAPMVIGHRLAGMAPPGSTPTARQRRESTRMGQEKVEAWSEATLATGQRLFQANLAMTALFWRQVWTGAFTPAAFTATLTRLGPRLLGDSLAPVHRRVVANNRRLSKARPASR